MGGRRGRAGEMEHVDQHRPAEIHDELRFTKPYKSKSRVTFQLDSVGDGTQLDWQMLGSLPWFMFWFRPTMQALIGMDFQRGLAMLRDLIEKGEVLSRTEVIGIEEVPAMTVCGVRESCRTEEIGAAMDRVFAKAKSSLQGHGVASDGEMISVYHPVDIKQGRFDFTGGYSLNAADAASLADLARCELPATRALHVRHTGSYHHLGNAWSGAHQYARYKKIKLAKGESYEIYRNDPTSTPESDWITDLYLPIR